MLPVVLFRRVVFSRTKPSSFGLIVWPQFSRFCTSLLMKEMNDKLGDETENKSVTSDESGNSSSMKRPHTVEAEECLDSKKVRVRKKKVAILLSYNGQGYLGMQVNHGFKTIEEDLFQAFTKVGIMDEESYTCPQSIQYQRAARTDKGVSAVRQVVSLKMSLTEEDMVQNICSHLPNSIRVFSIKKVTGGFNSKIACDYRTYSYIAPSFAFTPMEEIVNRLYRIPSAVLEEVNNILSLFKGTRNFHNFTSRRAPQDPSCKRYITEFSCSQPFLVKDMEFVKITVKGQSFMLHQIRKMVGLTIAILRGIASKETLEQAFKMQRVDIPIAPSLNLLLEEPHYTSYNRRYGNDGLHEPLIWDEYACEIEKFANEFIYPTIYKGEMEDNSMMNWLSTLPLHTYDVREDGPPPSQLRTEFGRALVAVKLENKNLSTEQKTNDENTAS